MKIKSLAALTAVPFLYAAAQGCTDAAVSTPTGASVDAGADVGASSDADATDAASDAGEPADADGGGIEGGVGLELDPYKLAWTALELMMFDPLKGFVRKETGGRLIDLLTGSSATQDAELRAIDDKLSAIIAQQAVMSKQIDDLSAQLAKTNAYLTSQIFGSSFNTASLFIDAKTTSGSYDGLSYFSQKKFVDLKTDEARFVGNFDFNEVDKEMTALHNIVTDPHYLAAVARYAALDSVDPSKGVSASETLRLEYFRALSRQLIGYKLVSQYDQFMTDLSTDGGDYTNSDIVRDRLTSGNKVYVNQIVDGANAYAQAATALAGMLSASPVHNAATATGDVIPNDYVGVGLERAMLVERSILASLDTSQVPSPVMRVVALSRATDDSFSALGVKEGILDGTPFTSDAIAAANGSSWTVTGDSGSTATSGILMNVGGQVQLVISGAWRAQVFEFPVLTPASATHITGSATLQFGQEMRFVPVQSEAPPALGHDESSPHGFVSLAFAGKSSLSNVTFDTHSAPVKTTWPSLSTTIDADGVSSRAHNLLGDASNASSHQTTSFNVQVSVKAQATVWHTAQVTERRFVAVVDQTNHWAASCNYSIDPNINTTAQVRFGANVLLGYSGRTSQSTITPQGCNGNDMDVKQIAKATDTFGGQEISNKVATNGAPFRTYRNGFALRTQDVSLTVGAVTLVLDGGCDNRQDLSNGPHRYYTETDASLKTFSIYVIGDGT